MDVNASTGGPETISTVVWRIRKAVVCLVIAAVAMNSDPGKIVADTKLDLVANPWGFLARALHVWDRQGYAGQLQNQAYGYFFPMGPFFGVGHTIGLPSWVVQRLWWAFLLSAAFLGFVALAERLGIGTPTARLVGGVGYALSPHLLTVLGPVSSEAMPMCFTPWALLPLVIYSQDGGSRRRAAMRSGVAVLFMGCVNAAVTFAALVPVIIWLLTRPANRAHVKLCAWWVLAVLAACLWWMVPLIVLGRYSPPFLNYIETAATTTSVTTLIESLRGTADWLAYLPTVGWRGGYALLTQPAVILNSCLLVALGLAGLTRADLPHRRMLVACLLTGIVVLCAGYAGPVHGAFTDQVRSALDGTLAPLRNVHKFDVALRIPLLLGLVHLLGSVRWGRLEIERRYTRIAAFVIVAAAVIGTAAPFVALRIAPRGDFSQIPRYWTQTATWLKDNAATDRALVVPGARFGYYNWGRGKDEPLQPLAATEWEVRDAVPIVPASHIRMLDAIEDRFVSGQASAGFAPYLQGNGIRYLVVRNDLDYGAAGSPRPAQIHAALASPGITRVATFGPDVGTSGTPTVMIDQGLQQSYPAVEIYRVGAATTDSRVALVGQSDITQISGAPESLLDVADAQVGSANASILTADGTGAIRPGGVVVTDGLRERERTFGRNDNATSQTLAQGEGLRIDKTERDYLTADETAHESVVRYQGIASLVASSSGSDASTLLPTQPGQQPFAAVDGDPTTAWVSAPVTAPVGQWLQVNLLGKRSVDGLSVQFAPGSRVQAVTVTTDSGTARTPITAGTGTDRAADTRLNVPIGPTASLRITVSAVTARTPALHQVGISQLRIPGVQVRRTLVVPVDLAPGTAVTDYVFRSADDAANGCLFFTGAPLCAADTARVSEDASGIDRTFTAPSAGTYAVAATAVPRAGVALDELLRTTVRPAITAVASSQVVADPIAGAQSVVDGDDATSWVASPDDVDPTLTLTWSGARRLSALKIVTNATVAATAPASVTVTAGGLSQTVDVAPTGQVSFTPVFASSITLVLHAPALRTNFDPTTSFPSSLGIGISEISVPGLAPTTRADSDSTAVTVPCGQAPPVTFDGRTYATRIDTTVGQVRSLRPVVLLSCAPDSLDAAESFNLSGGPHQLVAASSPLWRPTAVQLSATPAPASTTAAVDGALTMPVTVRSWQPTSAAIAVPARTEPAVLIVAENENVGWTARLDGRTLARVTVNGWQQGYVLPAGAAGVVQLNFGPETIYRAGLIVGLLAVLALLAAAGWTGRRRPAPAPVPTAARRLWPGLVPGAGLFALYVVGGRAGALIWLTVGAVIWLTRGIRSISLYRAGAAAAPLVLGGYLLMRTPWPDPGYAASTRLVQYLCLVALAVLVWAGSGRPQMSRWPTNRRISRRSATVGGSVPGDAAEPNPPPVAVTASSAPPPSGS